MPRFGRRSEARLATCHPDLQRLMRAVVEHFDITIVQGHRGQEEQDDYFARGLSKIKYPNGKHNKHPSLAVDIAPYPIDWNDTDRFYFMGGFVKAMALHLGISIRWGGDWDSDNILKEPNDHWDLPHFELR